MEQFYGELMLVVLNCKIIGFGYTMLEAKWGMGSYDRKVFSLYKG